MAVRALAVAVEGFVRVWLKVPRGRVLGDMDNIAGEVRKPGIVEHLAYQVEDGAQVELYVVVDVGKKARGIFGTDSRIDAFHR